MFSLVSNFPTFLPARPARPKRGVYRDHRPYTLPRDESLMHSLRRLLKVKELLCLK